MKIIYSFPPNIDAIKEKFGDAVNTCVFTYGDIIYYPNGKGTLPQHIITHEQVHEKQQMGKPELWWEKYLAKPEFRLLQEIPAYRLQYKEYKKTHIQPLAVILLAKLARDLSGPIYGNLISFDKAMNIIAKRK